MTNFRLTPVRLASPAKQLTLILALSTLVRVLIALHFGGFTRGDDVEILESAFKYGVGLDYAPWGIRNLSLPLLVAPFVHAARLIGLTSPGAEIFVATCLFVIVGSLSVALVYRLAQRWSTRQIVPSLAALVYSCHWLHLVYGSAPFPRVISTACILGSAVLVSGSDRPSRSDGIPLSRCFAGGCLIAFAFACRYSEALFLMPMLMLPFLRRGRHRRALHESMSIGAGFVLSACVFVGVIDWLTWGAPFASLARFFRFTLVEEQSSSIVAGQPVLWYLERLLHWLPVGAIPLLWIARNDRSAVRCWWFIASLVVGLSLVHHKELRYLQGAWPFMAILIAAGGAEMLRHRRFVLATTLLLLTLAQGVSRTTMVRKRSMAAVCAAKYLARSSARSVALSQAWAYGDTLYLGSKELLRLPLETAPEDLRGLPPRVDAVALYEDRLEASPILRQILRERGFTQSAHFERSKSRPVVVFASRTRGFAVRGAAAAHLPCPPLARR